MRINYNVYAEVNLDNLVKNLKFIQNINGNNKIIPVIKDDAYAHGIIEVANKFIDNGIQILSVGDINEGILLRKFGVRVPILVFGITPAENIDDLIKNDLTQTVSSFEYANIILEKLSRINKRLKVHIKVDTGMGRVGLIASDENFKIVNNICSNPLIDIQGVYSHFSDAGGEDKNYTVNQYKLFKLFCNNLSKLKLDIKYKHICNSEGSLNYRFDDIEYIRPGLSLYGYSMGKNYEELKPVMSLKAKVVHIKKANKGEYIGYGKTYRVDKESYIATLNIGYGHGYPRYLSNKGRVIVNNEFANIVGSICMDHCMIDITNIINIKLFDDVILIGSSGEKNIDAHEIARYGNTICYEVLCGIRRKVPRVYLEDNKIKYIREGYY
ncbi:Alanine racemase [Candidatus Arthromitus sp. SFB-mouse-NL]|uniref:alanine racemase n=1 Tax=Candidatus Arthromitus sp. SFB-mouse-NL TaxID=1508644 RepID=UPI00049B44F2|nr:alanine racemase [Candidatus Arthromitus sp. SFB-mouse-NL]AID44009.1 Alanine racemase [Candidatus Arthromitus sp. SFB-mouse-NL]